ncbi:MAG TPA: hypothetical protein VL463_29410 [Kofleriaceae bacterium]|jgi:hypothetical protein|nr:hypothetical protein [Kofleriaceae bacterium]
MPSGIIDVSSDKPSIKSGGSVRLTVSYFSKATHELTITASGKFSASYKQPQILAPDETGMVFVDVTITRGDPNDPHECILTCTFYNSLPVSIGVT